MTTNAQDYPRGHIAVLDPHRACTAIAGVLAHPSVLSRLLRLAREAFACFADRVVDQHVARDRVSPPPAQHQVQCQTDHHRDRRQAIDARNPPSVFRTGLSRAVPVRAFPAARANIAAAVTAVQIIPGRE